MACRYCLFLALLAAPAPGEQPLLPPAVELPAGEPSRPDAPYPDPQETQSWWLAGVAAAAGAWKLARRAR